MPRRSLRSSDATNTVESSGHAKITKSRASNNKPTLKATRKKSEHFTKKTQEESDSNLSDGESTSPSVADPETSAYEDADVTSDSLSDKSEEEEPGFDTDDERPKKRQRVTPRNTPKISATSEKGKELWRPSVKTGMGHGTQVIIDKPKARSPGKTPYKDHTIHPNTMLFLKELAENNDREWMKMHDPDYRIALKDFHSFMEQLQQRIMEFDETVPELPLKDVFFRIYRDIRFSPDPTPYKAHFSAAWSRTGRKGPYAVYYLQIKPGNCFIGGGLWQTEAHPLSLLRRDIDRRPQRIKQTLLDSRLRKEILGLDQANEKKAVQAFVNHNADSALKTKPKGYDADHKEIELLRLRNYTIGKKLADDEILSPKGLDRVSELLSCLVPFITYLNDTVMPDDRPSSSDDESTT